MKDDPERGLFARENRPGEIRRRRGTRDFCAIPSSLLKTPASISLNCGVVERNERGERERIREILNCSREH